MLEVYFGNDTDTVRRRAMERSTALRAKGVEMSTVTGDQYQVGMLRDAVGANSLFGGELGFVVDMPSSDAELQAEVIEQLEAMAASEHLFVVIEGVLLAAAKKPYQKYATVCEECKKAVGERFNTFAMADALATKNKKQLWLLLQEARRSGESAESIIGVMWWQLKALRLAALTNSAADAGMKDYPYQKAKRALSSFAPGELECLSQSLLAVYHDGHGGKVVIDDALEGWVLGV